MQQGLDSLQQGDTASAPAPLQVPDHEYPVSAPTPPPATTNLFSSASLLNSDTQISKPVVIPPPTIPSNPANGNDKKGKLDIEDHGEDAAADPDNMAGDGWEEDDDDMEDLDLTASEEEPATDDVAAASSKEPTVETETASGKAVETAPLLAAAASERVDGPPVVSNDEAKETVGSSSDDQLDEELIDTGETCPTRADYC
jgi:hypothetical protein